ncbi:O-antigen ligase family protein [Dietzia sp. NPDC055340]
MIVGLAVALAVCLGLFALALRRPQWGVLAIAALMPLHGLLLIYPVTVSFWKEAAVLAVLVACPFAPRAPHGRTVVAPWLIPFVVLAPVGIVSALVVHGAQAFFPLKIAFFYVLLAVIAVIFPFDRRDKDTFVTVLIVTGTISAVYGIWQQLIGPHALADMGYEWNEHIRSAGPLLRSFGTFNQPFPFGLFLMLVIIIGTSAALAEPHRLRSRLFMLAFPVLGLGMVLSVVRASYIGVVVGLVLIGLLLYRRFLGWLLVGAVVGGLVLAVFTAVFGTGALSAFISSSSLEDRGGHWTTNLPLIVTQPLGQGLGTTGSSAAKVAAGWDPVAPLYQPDSNVIKILLELGPVGFVCYTAIVLLMVIPLLRMMPVTEDPLERGLIGGVVAATLAACVAALFSTYLEIFPMDAYFWLFPAIAASTTTAVRDRITGRLRPGRPAVLTTHNTESTTAAIRSRKVASEKASANRASSDRE